MPQGMATGCIAEPVTARSIRPLCELKSVRAVLSLRSLFSDTLLATVEPVSDRKAETAPAAGYCASGFTTAEWETVSGTGNSPPLRIAAMNRAFSGVKPPAI